MKEIRDNINDFAGKVIDLAKEHGIDQLVFIASVNNTSDKTDALPTIEGMVSLAENPSWGVILASQLLGYTKGIYRMKAADKVMEQLQSDVQAGHCRLRDGENAIEQKSE